jgi:hypothetical protein
MNINVQTLRDTAITARLQTSNMWAGRKKDKAVTQEIAEMYGVSVTVGSYTKVLTKALGPIQTAIGAARKHFRDNTLPWEYNGTGILPIANHLTFTQEAREHKEKIEGLVKTFVEDTYPNEVLPNAPDRLKGLYNASDFPTKEKMSNKFRITYHYKPLINSTDFRVQGLSDEVLEDMKAQYEQDFLEAIKESHKDLWLRLYTELQELMEKLVGDDKLLVEARMDNLRRIVEILPRLNVLKDPELDNMIRLVDRKLCSLHAEDIRKDNKLKVVAAIETDSLLKNMKALMG